MFSVPGSNGIICDKDSVSETLNDLITLAALEARRRTDDTPTDLDAPTKYLKEAQKKVKFARERLKHAKDDPNFKKGDYYVQSKETV